MTTDAALLKLTHWLSPVFPVGGYAYSSGLETAIHDGSVSDEATLYDWLSVILTSGSGRTDAILVTAAMAQDADHDALDDWARALSGSAERWQETSEQGRAFAEAIAATEAGAGTHRALPVAVGEAARGLELDAAQVAALYLQSVVSNLVSIAVRHVPLGQMSGARVIGRLQPDILATATAAIGLGPEAAFTATPGADLAQMRHETQDVRIFRT